MTNQWFRGRAVVVLAVVFSVLPTVAHGDDDLHALREMRTELEIQIERLLRHVPPEIEPADALATLGRLARETELEHAFGEFSAPERVMYPDGSPSPIDVVRVDIGGTDHLGDVLFFLTMLRYAPGIVQLDSLHIEAAGAGSVTYAATLALPLYAGDRSERVRTGTDPIAAARAELDAARRLRDLLVNLVDDRQPAAASQAIAAFTNAVGPAPVALTEATIDGNLRMSGIAIGAAARSAIANAVADAGLTATAVEIPASGLCRPFRVAAALPHTIPEEPALVIGNGLFDGSADLCTHSNASPVTVSFQGTNPDGIELFLADADIASIFRLLSSLTDESFVLDHDVAGRVRLSVSGATIDETLDAMGAAGVVVGPPPLRRVARKGTATAPRDDDFSGERITVQLQRAALSDVLCLFTNLMALEFGMPPGLERQASIFANDLEWDRIVDGILASQHLERRIDDTRVLLGSDATKIDPATLVDACAAASVSASTTSTFASVAIEGLETSDLVLAGVAKSGADFIAQIEMPGGVLRDLAVGQQLLDGVVVSVDRSGITIADARGTTRRVELATAPATK